MHSLNLHFPGADVPTAVDPLGADAERRLRAEPDLAMLRVRQLLEVLVTDLELRNGLRQLEHKALGERIGGLQPAWLPAGVSHKDLRQLARDTNDAVHHNHLKPRTVARFEAPARQALLAMARAWAARAGVKPPESLRLPPLQSRLDTELRQAHLLLDGAEQAVEQRRDDRAAEHMLAAISIDALVKAGARAPDLELVALRTDSIRRALAKHSGASPEPHDAARCQRLLDGGQAEAAREVVHFLNRHAVACLNVLDLDGAEARLSELIEWRAAEPSFRPATLAAAEVRDWQLGALLGTAGQLAAFQAHALADPAALDPALALFAQAQEHFDEDDDRERHVTNRLHALVERVRLGGALSAAEHAEVAALVATAPVADLVGVSWHPAAFRVAAALKACDTLHLPAPWQPALIAALDAVSDDRPLSNPYEQIVGRLMRRIPNLPRRLTAALELTARASSQALVRWIAASYLAAAGRAPTPEPPQTLRAWWDSHDIAARAAADPLSALPFNYA